MIYLKYFESESRGVIETIYDWFISEYSGDVENLFDVFQDYEDGGLTLRVSVVYFSEREETQIFSLDKNLKPNSLEDKWFKLKLLENGNIDRDLVEVKIEIKSTYFSLVYGPDDVFQRPQVLDRRTIRHYDHFSRLVNEYINALGPYVKILSESHDGFPLNPDIYVTYKYNLRFL
jgi:hypothetical protein